VYSGKSRNSPMEHISFEINTFATMQATSLPTSVAKPRLLASELETSKVGGSIVSMVLFGISSYMHNRPKFNAIILAARISDLDGTRCWSLRYDDHETPVSTSF
jgi:hypothetical protein